MPPAVSCDLDRMPPLWDRRAIFVANLNALFFGNKEQTSVLNETVRGVRTYGGRLAAVLPILFARRPNLLLAEAAPDEALTEYLRGVLGLDLPDVVVFDPADYDLRRGTARDAPPSHPAEWMDGFVTDEALAEIAAWAGKRTITTVAGSKDGNNKLLLHEHLHASGRPVFDTLLAASPADVPRALAALAEKGYAHAVLKAQIGASGCGMFRLPTNEAGCDETRSVPEYLFYEGPCLVQGWFDETVEGVEVVGSPSVQWFVDDDRISLYDVTEQVLSRERIHEGNVAPPPYLRDAPRLQEKLLDAAGDVARFLHARGYRGTGSVDFLVVRRDGKAVPYVCEANARVTGATYPSLLGRRFAPGRTWLMRNVRFPKPLAGADLLARLEDARILFDPRASRDGVLPFNFNTRDDGRVEKGQFVAFGEDAEDCANRLASAAEACEAGWGFDRD